MKRQAITLGLISTLFIFSSCSMKKNMDEMHNNTKEMKQLTSQMASDVESTNNTSNSMFQLLKQGDGATSRNGDGTFYRIIEAKTMGDKKVEATTYFSAFEFQTWNKFRNQTWDAIEYRDIVIKMAVDELGNRLERFMEDDFPSSAYTSDNNQRSLFALAMTLHTVNHAQAGVISDSGLKPISLLDVIIEGLAKVKDYNEGKISKLKEWEQMVQIHEQRFVYLLQARYLILPVVALSVISDLGATKSNFFENFMIIHDLKNEDISRLAEKHNRSQIEFATEIIMDGTVTLGNFLDKIGKGIKVEKRTLKIFENLQSSLSKTDSKGKQTLMEREVSRLGNAAGALVKQAK